ncbi:MAG: hypothetical protein WD708_08230 [Kiritimatiellia bacterium]
MHTSIREALIDVLDQGALLLDQLTPDHYRQQVPEVLQGTIGAHYRHCLEHIDPLLDCVSSGIIDYDARPRDRSLETDRVLALAKTREYQQRLRALPGDHFSGLLSVRNRVMEGVEDSPVVASSMAREGMYAVAHAIHHYALIRVMCGFLKVSLPDSFGVAPSTLQYRKSIETH